MIIAAGIVKGALVLFNRLASWIGSGYFFRKGMKQKEKRFLVVSVLFSVLMLWALIYMLHRKWS